MYDLARTDANGDVRSRLVSQDQLDRAMENKKFRSAIEAGKQQGMFSADDLGELQGEKARSAITLPPQQSDDQPTLFRSENQAGGPREAETRLTRLLADESGEMFVAIGPSHPVAIVPLFPKQNYCCPLTRLFPRL